jgi:Protein of unknown function (DUF2848)
MRLSFDVVAGSPGGGWIDVEPTQVILGGYSARSAMDRRRHIDELRVIGIEPPASVPAFWRVARHLLTTRDAIEVQGEQTSGEAEFALIATGGRTWVTVASDQTDRELERVSIPRSKQLCPKVLGAEVVPLDHVRPRWDEIELSSDVSADGAGWFPYQRATLAELVDPETLLRASGLGATPPDGTILLSGTVPLVDGVTRFLPHFRAALVVPGTDVALRLAYRVDVLAEIVPQLTEAVE